MVLQTCNFAFMNRFTDGLQLPSEDEAIKVYHETYGATLDAGDEPALGANAQPAGARRQPRSCEPA